MSGSKERRTKKKKREEESDVGKEKVKVKKNLVV